MGVRDDLTSETRLDEDGVRYITEPSPNMGFFSLATAKDTRPLILHEGVPGHYLPDLFCPGQIRIGLEEDFLTPVLMKELPFM